MQKSTKISIAKQAAILGIAGIIVRAIGLLYRIPLSNIIGDIGNSYYGIAFNIYTVLLLLSGYSIPVAVSKLISNARALGQYKNAHKYFIKSIIFISIVSGCLSVLLYIFAPYILPVSNEKAVFALRTLAPTLFISGFVGVFQGYFHSIKNSFPTAIAQIFEQVINAIASIFFAFILTRYATGEIEKIGSLGALGSTMGTLFGALTSISILYYIYTLNRTKIYSEIKRDKSNINLSSKTIYRNLIILLIPIILSTVVSNISSVISQYIYFSIMNIRNINYLDVSTNYGIYVGKVIPISNIASSLAMSISIATLPNISMALAKKNRKLINTTINESVTLSMLFTLPATMGLFVLADKIIAAIFPNTINVGYISLQLIAIVIVLNAYYVVLSGVLQGLGKPIVTVITGIVSIIINIIFIVPLLYFTNLGVYSIILAAIPSTLIMCIICYIFLKNFTKYRQALLKPLILPLLASILMGAFCKLLYNVIIILVRFNLAALFITIPLTIFAYAIFIVKLNLINSHELKSMPYGHHLVKFLRKLKVI